jgi:hypothetical protein
MSTSQSPAWKLKAEGDRMARMLKSAELGEKLPNDPAGKMAAARQREAIKFAVAMDDKIITIEMTWATIKEMPEAKISEFIVNHMRGQRTTSH